MCHDQWGTFNLGELSTGGGAVVALLLLDRGGLDVSLQIEAKKSTRMTKHPIPAIAPAFDLGFGSGWGTEAG